MKAFIFVLLSVAVLGVWSADPITGVDVMTTNQPDWSCLYKQADFVVIRCFKNNGIIDNCADLVKDAHKAKFKHVDLHMTPCVKCSNASDQVTKLKNYISNHKLDYDSIWLDVTSSLLSSFSLLARRRLAVCTPTRTIGERSLAKTGLVARTCLSATPFGIKLPHWTTSRVLADGLLLP